MIKKLSIAAACSVALYGLVKLINRNIAVVTTTGLSPDVLAPTVLELDAGPNERSLSASQEELATTSPTVESTETAETDSDWARSQLPAPEDKLQVAPCL